MHLQSPLEERQRVPDVALPNKQTRHSAFQVAWNQQTFFPELTQILVFRLLDQTAQFSHNVVPLGQKHELTRPVEGQHHLEPRLDPAHQLPELQHFLNGRFLVRVVLSRLQELCHHVIWLHDRASQVSGGNQREHVS